MCNSIPRRRKKARGQKNFSAARLSNIHIFLYIHFVFFSLSPALIFPYHEKIPVFRVIFPGYLYIYLLTVHRLLGYTQANALGAAPGK